MNQKEFEYWQSVTAGSAYRWIEDAVTRLNGNGSLFYSGGEDGVYMRLTRGGKFSGGTYEGAVPHIGEACFIPKAEHQYADYNGAFEAALKLGGKQFLIDMFSQDSPPQVMELDDEPGMTFEMKM
jgi:hypothetical protein